MAYKRTIAHTVWIDRMTCRVPRQKEIRLRFGSLLQGGSYVAGEFRCFSFVEGWTISLWRNRLFSTCPSAHFENFSLFVCFFFIVFCLVQLNEINADTFFFLDLGQFAAVALRPDKKIIWYWSDRASNMHLNMMVAYSPIVTQTTHKKNRTKIREIIFVEIVTISPCMILTWRPMPFYCILQFCQIDQCLMLNAWHRINSNIRI